MEEEKKVFEGYATFYEEKMSGTMEKSLFLYPTLALAEQAVEKAGRMRAYLIGGRARRVRIEVLE